MKTMVLNGYDLSRDEHNHFRFFDKLKDGYANNCDIVIPNDLIQKLYEQLIKKYGYDI